VCAWALVARFEHELTAHASALIDERTLLVVGGLEPEDEAEICRLP